MKLLLALAVLSTADALESSTELNVNPMRKVVTMLQMMAKKVEAEGEKEQEMFDKFMCYCKTSGETLGASIADAEEKIPQLESDIKEAESTAQQLADDLVTHKADRDAAKDAIAKATGIRGKEAAEYLKESSEDKSNIAAMGKAIAAIEKGMAGTFLQTNAASVLRRLTMSQDMTNADRDLLSSFLAVGGSQRYAPASGEIVGILKQMEDTMNKDLAEITAAEDEAKQNFAGLMAAKEKEIEACTKAIEEKTKRVGEVGIEIVNLKEDLDDTSKSLAEDKQFLADLQKNCATKEEEWAAICKTRSEELIAIAETIKILNDDDALELFKKAVPSAASASLLQMQVSSKEVKAQALRALAAVRHAGDHNTGLDLISLALKGKKVDFGKVLGMIDDMVVLLGKEQVDDDTKKAYCEEEFDKADDKKKGLERKISDLEKAIAEMTEMSDTLVKEIAGLEDGIVALDKSVALATEQRKEEHTDFVQSLAENNAVMGIIDVAKNRLNKFYNPKMYKPPPKRELTEEERITLNMGGTLAPTNPPAGVAGTGITAFVQLHEVAQEVDAPGPAPATAGFKKKGAESGGVIAMMDMMKADVAKETQEMEFEEKDSQAEYEKMVNDAAAKRAADLKSIAEKEAAKAEIEAELIKVKNQKKVEETELMATKEYIANLHSDCDWLLQNFQVRKEARANEIDALNKAKAVLSGADYSLVQTGRHTSLRRGQKS